MEYRELGRSGVAVSRLALGCGNFGGIGSAPAFFGQGESRDEAFALLDAARRVGITLLDTADAYGGGRSEQLDRRLARRTRPATARSWRRRCSTRSSATRTTRGSRPRGSAASSRAASSGSALERDRPLPHPRHRPRDADRRHAGAPSTSSCAPGTVGAIGASNIGARRARGGARAQRGARARALRVRAELVLAARPRRAEDVLALCERHGLGFTPFGPLAGGWLTGKYRRGAAARRGLADGDAARAVPPLRRRRRLRRPRRARRARAARAAPTRRRSRSPGCSPTSASAR